MKVFYSLSCDCGHVGLISLAGFLHRERLIERCRCSVCGRRGFCDVRTYVPGSEAPEMQAEAYRYAESLPVHQV